MGLMDAVAGGLSAAGYAAGDVLAKGALMDQQNEAETQRAMRLADFKAQLELKMSTQAREQQSARIDQKAGELADQKLADKRGLIDANIADRSSWTPEMQAAVDQSLARDRQEMVSSDAMRVQAAKATGDISPKDVMADDTHNQIAQVRADTAKQIQDVKTGAFMEKLSYLQNKADEDRRSRELIAAMRAVGKGDSDKETAKIKTAQTYLETVNRERKAAGQEPITFEEAYTISNYAPRADPEANTRARVAMKLIENDPKLARDPDALNGALDNTMQIVNGERAAAAPKPAASGQKPSTSAPAAAALPPGLPSGSRQIGTSGGKPVYQTPDGKRFVLQ